MSEIGYSGREMLVMLDGSPLAAIQSKTFTLGKESIDVTSDDSDGYRVLLPAAGLRSIDTSIEGVATSDNWGFLLNAWQGDEHLDVTIQGPDGTTLAAEYGFFFGSLEFSGESAGHVAFSATLQSSGPVSIGYAPAPSPTPTPTPTPAADWRPMGADEVAYWLPLSITATDTYQGATYPFTLPATTNTEPASAMVALFEPVGDWSLADRRPSSITVHLTAPMQVDIVSVEAFSAGGSLGNESSWNGVWGEGDDMSITIPIRPYDWDEEQVEGLVLVATYLGSPETVNGHWPVIRGIDLGYGTI